MKKKHALILVSLSCFTAAHGSSILQVDFSTATGTQAGWETISGTGSPSGSFSGYTGLAAGNVNVSLSNIAFNRTYRNGGSGEDFPGTDLDAMYGDLLFRNNGNLPVNVTIEGLLAGTYQITTHHLIDSPNPGTFDLRAQDADSPGFGQFIGNFDQGTGYVNGNRNPPEAFDPTVISFEVESNGTDPIILQMTQTSASSGGNTGGWFGYNGLEIAAVVPIPEPSSSALLGLGALGLLLRRRR